ncbi:MAG: PilZ domain-containing protein [Aquificae bacterium]|nr:PilZ domain-containing protein [Aquificota bacterium]
MEKTKSTGLIGWLKKVKKLEVVAFYEEIPIRGIIELEEIDEKLQQIIWKSNGRLTAPLKETRHLYFRKDGDIYVLSVIAFDDKEIATSFPMLAVDRKLDRAYIRVKVSEEDPIEIMIDGIHMLVDDISEAGAGVVVEEDKVVEIQPGEEYEILIKIRGEIIKLKGLVVYKINVGKNKVRLGIRFTDIKVKDRDKIAKYVMDRQREIAKKIFMLNG